MPVSPVVVEVHQLELTTGHWCPTCALPSALHQLIAVVDHQTLRIVTRQRRTFCTECHSQHPLPV